MLRFPISILILWTTVVVNRRTGDDDFCRLFHAHRACILHPLHPTLGVCHPYPYPPFRSVFCSPFPLQWVPFVSSSPPCAPSAHVSTNVLYRVVPVQTLRIKDVAHQCASSARRLSTGKRPVLPWRPQWHSPPFPSSYVWGLLAQRPPLGLLHHIPIPTPILLRTLTLHTLIPPAAAHAVFICEASASHMSTHEHMSTFASHK